MVMFGLMVGTLLLALSGCGSSSRMQDDWDDLTKTQRLLLCDIYGTKPSSEFAGAAEDLGWELGTMMRFLEKHC
jgi:hypothetical protein